ncbi:MAG TPA: biopolymer transporter ExbD [Haliea salexigens]|jgi:biopolymer transport protein ExbD|uniref:Biopolymer transporter ExbD n=1 Tax=Haliea salexigens TaxID=287487 RepID=A0A3C1KQ54_9GAMM|nr:biopolymer transporter ExbD [Haliea salexigens]MAA86607.1 biopolymer transporter ExbD [Haliea sp.]HAN28618.1 biopolymer transporter ExbD [Haliea salexigens]|tara:strand:- start:2204 stop:2620 length:417 start_codon:yes stop_codon:yes gene_type:complete
MSIRDNAARKAAADEGNIDLTPMLDVVFIMLIFFIVTSSFVKEPGVELLKPQATTTEACERGTIIFAVDDRGEIFYDKNRVSLDRAARLAEGAKKEAPQANIVVQVDRDTPAFAVEQLVDEIRPLLTAPPCISTDDEV